MSPFVKLLIACNLLLLTALVFIYPHLMLAPGKLIPGHRSLETDCFACHAAFAGAASQRCISCHKPETIGKLSTQGLPLKNPLTKVAFHQQLSTQDCVACHSDHSGVRRFRQQGRFDHALLQPWTRNDCQTCHRAPGDPLHRQLTGRCSQCHSVQGWKPATFDHDRYFALDGEHKARCVTCHTGNDYSRYTCYGCHEHSPGKIRREHIEEGIRKFDNCVECHRGGEREGHGEGRCRGRGHDD